MRPYAIFLIFALFLVNAQESRSEISVLMKCKKAVVDVVIVLDSSFSVGPRHWLEQLKFLKALVDPFSVGKSRARFGVIVFNTVVRYKIHLSNRLNKAQLKKKMEELKYHIGLTFTGEALLKAKSVFGKEGRKKAKKMVILVTDGKSNGLKNPIKVADQLKKEGIMIISVGVTHRVNKGELNAISSSGHFIEVKDFKLLSGVITKEVQKKSCSISLVKVCSRHKSDVTFILDSSTSIGPAHWRETLNFVERLTDPLYIGRKSSRVALMTFNTSPTLQFLYKKYLNKRALVKKGIHNAVFTEGLTYMGTALNFFRKNLYPKMRKGVSKIVVLISDGYANGHINVIKEANRLKRMGVQFITVGVTKHINVKRLRNISTSKKVYRATKFSDLKDIIKKVQGEVCKEIKTK